MSEELRVPLRIVFYQEDGDWIAHCLEFDLMGDGATREEALARLVEAVMLQVEASVESDNPANLFNPADGRILRMFAAGQDVAAATLVFQEIHTANLHIDRLEFREYLGASPSCMAT